MLKDQVICSRNKQKANFLIIVTRDLSVFKLLSYLLWPLFTVCFPVVKWCLLCDLKAKQLPSGCLSTPVEPISIISQLVTQREMRSGGGMEVGVFWNKY